MKFRWLVLVALFFPTMAFGGNLSNPALPVPTGKVSIGLEHNFWDNAFTPDKDTTIDTVGGVPDSWGDTDVNMRQFYLKGAYGFLEGNEVYLKLGMTDIKSDEDAFVLGDAEFKDSNIFSGAIGIKQSFEVAPKVRVGGTLQYTHFSGSDKKFELGGLTERVKVENPWELDAAVAISYVGDGVAPYVGVIASWRRFDIKDDITLGGVPVFSTSNEYEEKNLIGALLGWELYTGNFRGNIEFQAFKEAQISVGTSVSYLF